MFSILVKGLCASRLCQVEKPEPSEEFDGPLPPAAGFQLFTIPNV